MHSAMARWRCSGSVHENLFSFTMLASLALLGKKRAKSVARMQFFIVCRTSLYSSGFRAEKMLFCSWEQIFYSTSSTLIYYLL